LEATTPFVELVLRERDGSCWGANLPLTTEWREARLPLASLRFFPHWAGNPPSRGGNGDRFQPQEVSAVNVCFGAWLYPDATAQPHTIEIERITLE
jgi:hypothetical protein